jgi:hypothetical protein
LLSLIFFVLLFLTACKQNKKEEISIIWNNKLATGISIPKNLLKEFDSISQLQIRLANKEVAMLGEYTISDDYILFKPVVPFSPGFSYEVFFRNNLLNNVDVPKTSVEEASRLVAVYPSVDTLPENLLKFYFQFSAPMREGEALRHISLLDNDGDTLPGIFLDMQPELWNKERTVLTLWLDPGRIKRDLIPNQKMGNPLKNGKQYTLVVSEDWKDAQGLPLQKTYNRKFIVSGRDSISPQPLLWKINLPKAQTAGSLFITTGEPLDYFLLKETIYFINEKGIAVPGTLKIVNKETGIEFIPNQPWQPGHYHMQVASYLEDLCGNNLERLFDRDMRVAPEKKEQAFAEKEFVIGNQ